MLFERQATEVTATGNLAELLPPSGVDRHACANRRPVAPYSLQPHVEIITGKGLRTVDAGSEQIAGISSPGSDEYRQPPIAEQVCHIDAMALAGERQPRRKRRVAELLPVVFKDNHR